MVFYWYFISENPHITWEIIENNPEINWDWQGISRNPNITLEIINDNPDKDWNWNLISQNKFEYTFYKLRNTEFGKRRRKQKIKEFKGSIPIIEDVENIILEFMF